VKFDFKSNDFSQNDINYIRAYLREKYPNRPEIDNHKDNNEFRYVYPELQFKIVNGNLSIIGHNSGIEILTDMVAGNLDEVNIQGDIKKVNNIQLQSFQEKFGLANKKIEYKFIQPWMALNEKNHKKLHRTPVSEWDEELCRILKGNFMSISRGFDYWIPDLDELEVEGSFDPDTTEFKGKEMDIFYGKFETNFYIPDYLGIGKQVARGYGTVKKINT